MDPHAAKRVAVPSYSGTQAKKPKLAEKFFTDAKTLSGAVKHGILRRYLGAWFAKLCQNRFRARYGHSKLNPQYSKVVYIDGFAGPGLHKNGDAEEYGSPVLTYELVLDHTRLGEDRNSPQICLIFIEKNNVNCKQLFDNLVEMRERKKEAKNVNKVQFMVINGEFASAMRWIISSDFHFPEDASKQIHGVPEEFTELARGNGSEALPTSSSIRKFITKTTPVFVFIDPFGYSGERMPMTLMKAILALSSKAELFVNLMTGFMRRFWFLDSRAMPVNKLVGDDEYDTTWKPLVLCGKTPQEKVEIFLSHYKDKLSDGLGASLYPLKFEMRNHLNALSYHLFFVSRHFKGLEAMKQAMKTFSQAFTEFKFSGFRELKGDLEPKKYPIETVTELSIDHFREFGESKANKVSGQDIVEFIVLKTNYLPDKVLLKKALMDYLVSEGTNRFHEMVYDFTQEQVDKQICKRAMMG